MDNNAKTDACCDESTVGPVGDPRKVPARPRQFRLFDIVDPIPAEIYDSRELNDLFTEWPFVPFASYEHTTGHSLLTWYIMLANLSATNAAAIGKKSTYALGGMATAIYAEDILFDTGEGEREATVSDKVAYREMLKEIEFAPGDLHRLARLCSWSYQGTGNLWLMVSTSTVNGETRSKVEYKAPTNVLYVRTENNEPSVVAVSPMWTKQYLDKYPPMIVPVYPLSADDGGVIRTMIHVKAGSNSYYGRPEAEAAAPSMYSEVQNVLFRIRQAGSDFTPRMVMEVEAGEDGEDPLADPGINKTFKNFADSFENSYTQKSSDPKSVLITSRPHGSSPMLVQSIPSQSNQYYFRVMSEINRDDIMRNQNVTQRFMSLDVSGGFSTEVYISDYIINMEPVLNRLRRTVCNAINKAITQHLQISGNMALNELSLTFKSPIASTVETYRNGSQNNNAR